MIFLNKYYSIFLGYVKILNELNIKDFLKYIIYVFTKSNVKKLIMF